MKRCYYDRHEYSGPKPGAKKSRIMMKRHHGVEMGRHEVWRYSSSSIAMNKQQKEVPPLFQTNSSQATTRSCNTNTLRTYTRVPKMHIEANYSQQGNEIIEETQNECTENQVTWPENEDSINDFELQIEPDQSIPFDGLKGYRIVDIRHVITWSIKLALHYKTCTGSQIEFLKEIRSGLHSKLIFICIMCKKKFENYTEPHTEDTLPKSNKAFVWGTLTAGSYYSQSTHILQLLDIPSMTQNQFHIIEKHLGNVWENHLTDEIMKAGREEREIALQKGNVTENGVPYATVYVDGGWSKRSYGHNFNAASGIGVIVGKETKKCLFLGVRNKYCSVCQRNSTKDNNDVEPHDCFKNYSGPSTAMEADILVQGFQQSEPMHGLQYLEFVGDGDSSVFAKLQENVSYGRNIRKVECVNHVIKNYTKALYKVTANTKLPLKGRKILKQKIQKMTAIARRIIVHNSGKPQIIRSDLRSGLHHVFGGHDKCEQYYCKWKKAADDGDKECSPDTNNFDEIKKETLVWSSICAANESVVLKAGRLTNETTNVVENLMSVLAKFNCGKRLCLTKRGSFQRRAHLTGLSQNTGNMWHLDLWKKAYKQSPGNHLKTYILRKEKSRLRKKNEIRRRLFKKAPKAVADKHYGPEAENPPQENKMSPAEVAAESVVVLQTMQMTDEDIKRVEEGTREQHDSELYKIYRENRLTSSLFGMICKRRPTTPCNGHVKTVLYSKEFSTKETKLGQENEPFIREQFATEYNKVVRPCGLYIDREYGFIASSPDGIVVEEDAVLEVKCFPSLKKWAEKIKENHPLQNGSLIEKAAAVKPNFPLVLKNGTMAMNRNHNHFYQVQGQMRVTGKKICYYVASALAAEPLTVIKVDADDYFINVMMKKLISFYKSCILPETILRRGGKDKRWQCYSCEERLKK